MKKQAYCTKIRYFIPENNTMPNAPLPNPAGARDCLSGNTVRRPDRSAVGQFDVGHTGTAAAVIHEQEALQITLSHTGTAGIR